MNGFRPITYYSIPYNVGRVKRNVILFLAVIVTLVLAVNSYRRIGDFRSAAKTVDERQAYLEDLKKKNEELKKELEYKESTQFAELEIRNKLGLAKPGETVVMVPKEETKNQKPETRDQRPNWRKWKELLFGV